MTKQKEITRTVTLSKIFWSTITNKEGIPVIEYQSYIETYGKTNQTKAKKIVEARCEEIDSENYDSRRCLNNPDDFTFIITSIEEYEEVRAISFEDFLECSHVVIRPPSQRKSEEE